MESSQPQLSKSPMLQFFVKVYITPAALMACTKAVSLVAINNKVILKKEKRRWSDSIHFKVKLIGKYILILTIVLTTPQAVMRR